MICGHIHKPEIRQIDGITYCNDGDWVESLSALVEEPSGALRLVTWQEIMGHTPMERAARVAAGKGELCEFPS